MKKKILAAILCVLMILPCFTWIAGAADLDIVPDGVVPENIAPYGKTYHSSIWNQDGSARFLNNGILYSSWQFWRPGSNQRPDTPGIDDTDDGFFDVAVGIAHGLDQAVLDQTDTVAALFPGDGVVVLVVSPCLPGLRTNIFHGFHLVFSCRLRNRRGYISGSMCFTPS